MIKIGTFTAVCEQDMHWFDQFMRQSEILGYPVSWFADHLSNESLQRLHDHPLTVAVHNNQVAQFSERSRQFALDALRGFDWAMQMDIDETWEDGAKEKIESSLDPERHIGNVPMITVVQRGDKLFRRTDIYYTEGRESVRERIYNLKYEWKWLDPITNGACLHEGGKRIEEYTNFPVTAASVHWGYSTPKLREEHVEKWDGENGVYAKNGRPHPYAKYLGLANEGDEVPVEPLEDKYFRHLWANR